MTVPLLILALAVICATLAVALGKGEAMPAVARDLPPLRLPAEDGSVQTLEAVDLDRLRFPVVLRGYRMADVEAVLDRLRDQLELALGEIEQLRAPTPTPPLAPVLAAESDESVKKVQPDAVEPGAVQFVAVQPDAVKPEVVQPDEAPAAPRPEASA